MSLDRAIKVPGWTFRYGLIITVVRPNRQWSHTVQLSQAPLGFATQENIVKDVTPNSPAHIAGMPSGHVILEVQYQDVRKASSRNVLHVIKEVSDMLQRQGHYGAVPTTGDTAPRPIPFPRGGHGSRGPPTTGRPRREHADTTRQHHSGRCGR